MQFIDTHCHIHQADYPLDSEEIWQQAKKANVSKLICVGTDKVSSNQAVEFAAKHGEIYASVGLHPHEAKYGAGGLAELAAQPKVIAIGECGLDYFYKHSPKDQQIEVFNQQIELALKHDLPLIFHVREALDDFWPIIDNFHGLRGVLHSFTGSQAELEKALSRDLFIGVNGISTFAKQPDLQKMFANIPLENLLLETDAPFLTPAPYRGKINAPAYVVLVAEYVAKLKQVSLEEIASVTSENANRLFALNNKS